MHKELRTMLMRYYTHVLVFQQGQFIYNLLLFAGSIPNRHPAIQVGGCNNDDGFRGYADDVSVMHI